MDEQAMSSHAAEAGRGGGAVGGDDAADRGPHLRALRCDAAPERVRPLMGSAWPLLGADMLDDEQVLVDINYLDNPYCAYNAAWSCPLPPREN